MNVELIKNITDKLADLVTNKKLDCISSYTRNGLSIEKFRLRLDGMKDITLIKEVYPSEEYPILSYEIVGPDRVPTWFNIQENEGFLQKVYDCIKEK